MAFVKKVIVGAAAAVASYYAAKLVKDLLEDRCLMDRIDDAKTTVADVQVGLKNKAAEWDTTARTKYGEVIDKLDELYHGKKEE